MQETLHLSTAFLTIKADRFYSFSFDSPIYPPSSLLGLEIVYTVLLKVSNMST